MRKRKISTDPNDVWRAIKENAAAIKELREAQKKTDRQINELREAQKRTDRQINELREAQKRTDERVDKLIEEMRAGFKELRSAIGKLEENFGWSLNDLALGMLPLWFEKYENIKVDQFERLMHDSLEIDIFYEGVDFVIIGEVKTRVGVGDIDKLWNDIDAAKKVLPTIRNKRIIPCIFCRIINLTARERAIKENIRIVTTYYSVG